MRRTAAVMIAAITLLISGCDKDGSGQEGGNRADLLTSSPPATLFHDAGCTLFVPRKIDITGPQAALAEACQTDDGARVSLKNTSPVVLRVTNTGSTEVTWTIYRPNDSSLATAALNQTIQTDYDETGAPLLVPGGSLVAAGAAPIGLNFTISLTQTTLAYGSKVLANWASGLLAKAKSQQYPGSEILQKIAACVTTAKDAFADFAYHNNEDAIVQVANSYLNCRTLFQDVRKLVDEPPPSAATVSELAAIGRVAKTTAFEDGVRFGARLAKFVVRVR